MLGGFFPPQIFAFTVKKLERLGVSGVVIEDKPLGFIFFEKKYIPEN